MRLNIQTYSTGNVKWPFFWYIQIFIFYWMIINTDVLEPVTDRDDFWLSFSKSMKNCCCSYSHSRVLCLVNTKKFITVFIKDFDCLPDLITCGKCNKTWFLFKKRSAILTKKPKLFLQKKAFYERFIEKCVTSGHLMEKTDWKKIFPCTFPLHLCWVKSKNFVLIATFIFFVPLFERNNLGRSRSEMK